MDPIGSAASIIALLQLSEAVLGTCYRYVGKVKDAASDIERVIHQVGYLTTILRDLKGVTESDGASTLASLTGDHGPLAVCTRGLEELKAKLPDKPVGLRQKLQWPFESKKINGIMDRIMGQVPIMELAVVGDIRVTQEDIQRREEREKVLNWLRCADPTVKHLASRRLHQTGSNNWILESEKFKEWRDNPGQTLWLHGIPGAGKTIICSTIIDHIEELCKTKPELRLAYYYFDFSDQDVQKLDTVLRCLIWQLCEHLEDLPEAVWTLYESSDKGRKQPSDESLADTLFKLFDPSQPDYIILDALDECPIEIRENFYELFLDRIDGHFGNFLFTSRKERDIEEKITSLNVRLHNIPIPAEDVNADVRLHVTQVMSQHRTMKNWSKDLKSEIETTLSIGAQGMFRWAVCQLDLIKNCRQAGLVRKTLKNLPKTLDDTYERILAAIPDETWQIARSALMLLTYSMRPLTIEELAEAMVIDYEEQSFDPEEHRLTNPREVLDICSSLISVYTTGTQMGKNPPWVQEKRAIEWRNHESSNREPLEVVQFAHFSVKEYMMLERCKSNSRVARLSFAPAVAHRSIAELSLVYLLDFSGGLRLPRISFKAFPFLSYAAQYWPEHWKEQLDAPDQETLNRLIQQIFDTDEGHSDYINYLNICRPDAFVDKSIIYSSIPEAVRSLDSIPQPLYYAAKLGHSQLCEWLLDERGCDVNAVKGKFGQAIQVAARFGHRNVVRLLLDRGAEIDRPCGVHTYPLKAAAYGGHVDIMKLLMDRGPDPPALSAGYGSALFDAVGQKHLDATKLLIDRGADIINPFLGKALSQAIAIGNQDLAWLLLRGGADINEPCGQFGGALYRAADEGNLEMVKILVTAGADVNLRSGRKGSPLQAVCFPSESVEDGSRSLNIAKFLLQHGADPNMHGGEYGDALQAAISYSADLGDVSMINLLLDHGADITYDGGFCHSAMLASAFHGHTMAGHILIDRGAKIDDDVFLYAVENKQETIVPLLLKRGVDVNAQNSEYTALQLAIKNQDETMTQLLISHPDIDVRAIGCGNDRSYGPGVTALGFAVSNKNKAVATQLLDLGADVNQHSWGESCPYIAAEREDIEMVNLLLDHGADINATIPYGGSALMSACGSRNYDLVQCLLDRGADVNLWVPGIGDALQKAAYNGDEDIVRLLLIHGAKLLAPPDANSSRLEHAIHSNNASLVRFFLDPGAYIRVSESIEDIRKQYIGFGAINASIKYKQGGLTQILIERGADINYLGDTDYEYATPLEEAIQQDDEDAVKLLLKHGADVNLPAKGYHEGVLSCAILEVYTNQSCDKYMQLLLDAGADVNFRGGNWGSPLGAAIHRGTASVVEKLLDLGADVNAPAGSQGLPLCVAVSEGDIDIFRLLLRRGANPNAPPGDGVTPLTAAAERSLNTMLQELLDHGADPKAANSSAICSAAREGNIQGIKMLIEHGGEILDSPRDILHEVVRTIHIETVRFLLDKGVDVNSFTWEHGTALMESFGAYDVDKAGREQMTRILLDAGAHVNSPPSEFHTSALQAAIDGRDENVVELLLDAGADVNAYDPRLGTALTSASKLGLSEVMKKLVEKGANPTLPGEKYGSPLQAAARKHRTEAVEYLLSLGVNVNQLSGKTGYALHAACRQDFDTGMRVIKMLLDHGADPNARGGKYETALQSAAKHGQLGSVKLLLKAGADPTIEGGKYGTPLKAAMAKKKHYHVADYLKRVMSGQVSSVGQ